MFQGFEKLLVDAVLAEGARGVLDVGCGTGATTLALARQLAPGGGCTGIDISEPMLALARERAERAGVAADFIRADAQDYPFQTASFDMIVSRFGVMFFADPVRAFANLRRASRPGAALRVAVWRRPEENPFMTAAERAVAPMLPNLPPRRPDGPGQFAFADSHRVRALLADSGWAEVELSPIDVACTFSEADLTRYITHLGPVGQALAAADERTRARITELARAAFDAYVYGPEVRFTAACWMIAARAP